ncbi:hypothetical protein D9756_002650 [Leucocoprinus leucothites]|uniref:Uncharacterized protein n=1 Tax=Leucocoprinus leucothites TaxID=201217 RepID=A0A8H5GCR2_9AGAR|nr:hypothetical protein D9756_002650 [Leucoagaricus leucothites]
MPSHSGARKNQAINRSVSGARNHVASHYSAPESESVSPLQGNRKPSAVSPANLQRRPSAPSLRSPSVAPGFTSSVLGSLNNARKERRDGNINDVDLDEGTNMGMNHFTTYDFLCGSETYFHSSLDGSVDFNRPPSQMSLFGSNIDNDSNARDYFKQIQGRSTPNLSRLSNSCPKTTSTSEALAGGRNNLAYQESREVNQDSPWISDSIISPPTYYKQQKNHDLSVVEHTLEETVEDVELIHLISPIPDGTPGAPTLESPVEAMSSGTQEDEEKSPLSLRKTGSRVIRLDTTVSNRDFAEASTYSDCGEKENSEISSETSRNRRTPGFSRTRSGTIIQNKISGRRALGRRNRSGTIIQGGGGARRTRSGTVVQATQEGRGIAAKPRHSSNAHEDQPQENDKSQDENCSCRSSDDELMLRSHSHHDLDAEELEWNVADPPSPVVRRLRRARRQHAFRRRRERGKTSNPDPFSAVIEEAGWEDGIEGDIEDDELDLLGNFVPEDW